MFVKVMSPVLLTNPPNTTELPSETWPGGQLSVMVMFGVVISAQLADAVLLIAMPVLASLPVAVSVSAKEQTFSGMG
jgi:hypothetical protein